MRTKGPIKVYAVGQYGSDKFRLQMSYGVSAKKISSALGDALRPRCKDAAQIEEFEACLLKGLPGGAPAGTVLEFATGGRELHVSVNNKSLGAVGTKVRQTAAQHPRCPPCGCRRRRTSPRAVAPTNPGAVHGLREYLHRQEGRL